ncbi:MAG: AbrB/MazE/SpoVT family DNA-binding domain-containing protein [Thermomicrobiales bacterium]
MTSTVKVSSRNQIVIPAEARKELGIKPGDELIASVRDGLIILIPKPDDIVAHLRGLHKEIWEDVDTDEYINQERDAWQD